MKPAIDDSFEAANDGRFDGVLAFWERWASPVAIIVILAALGILLWILPFAAAAETLIGRVVGVTDGDTITVLDLNRKKHKIRLAGIDAPERKQDFGVRARQRLSYILYNKPVSIKYEKRDRYGRIVGKVWVAPGDACPSAGPECPKTLDAGLAMITVGLAWHYKKYEMEQSEEDRERYSFAEKEASARRAGLWGDGVPVPPWEWRRKGRQ